MKVVAVLSAVVLAVRGDEDAFDEDGDFDMGDTGDMGGMGDPYGDDEYGGYGGYGGGMGDEYGGGEDSTPGYELLDDVDSVQKFVDADEVEPSVIGFFDEERDADDIAKFEELANANRYDFRFAYSIEDDVRAAFKFTSGIGVLVYPPSRFVSEKYDKKRARYPSKKIDVDSLKKFALKKSLPLVGQRTWKSSDRYDKAGLPIVTLFAKVDLEKNSKGFDYFANRLRKVATEYVGKVVFNVADKEDFSYQLEDYGLDLAEKKDVGVGAKDGAMYYAMEDKFNVENLKSFCAALVAGTLVGKEKVEADYETGDGDDDDTEADYGDVSYASTSVVQLTAENFDAETSGKDALLEFYAPWCGHCKSLKPAYAQVADALANVDSVVVGAMDATAHDPPAEFEVQGYPTIFFKPRGGEAINYDGDRDAASMLDYIKANAAVPITDEL